MKIYWGTRAVAQAVIECLVSMMKFWSNSQHSTKWAWWPAALEVQHGHLAWVWPSWPWMLSCLYHHSCCHCLVRRKTEQNRRPSPHSASAWAAPTRGAEHVAQQKGSLMEGPQKVPSVTKASVNLLSMPITVMSWAVTPKFTCVSPSPQNLRMWPYLELRLL